MNKENSILNGPPITILLVEDEPAHAEIVRRNLSAFPVAHRLIHVGDGQMALDYLLRQEGYADPVCSPRPELILLDLRLPKVDGLEVLRQIKSSRDLETIPTVVLTTSATDSDLAAAYSLGARSYQLKPANFEGFTELLDTNYRPASGKQRVSHE
ncbi:MAG: response regulator [Verrucomicrobiae bacterium]